MKKYSASNFDIAFWTGYYGDGEDYFSWASNKAYLDMNRTMTFKDIPKNGSQSEKNRVDADRKAWRDKGTIVIRESFRRLDGDFEEWHKVTCNKIIDIYGVDKLVMREGNARTDRPSKLTYGQAQKWLNMTLKYLWLLDRLDIIDNEKDSSTIREFQSYFHVPLDSYVLRYITKQDKNKKCPFSSENDNGLRDEYSFEGLWGSTWSQIDDVDKYYELQQRISLAVGEKTPLEWELEHWHKALKYYG